MTSPTQFDKIMDSSQGDSFSWIHACEVGGLFNLNCEDSQANSVLLQLPDRAAATISLQIKPVNSERYRFLHETRVLASYGGILLVVLSLCTLFSCLCLVAY